MLAVAIIGDGLAGLSLAQHLNSIDMDFCVFEARARFGGRILSQSPNDSRDFRVDLGPSWIWPDDQPLIAELIQQNKLEYYAQWSQGNSLFQLDHWNDKLFFGGTETARVFGGYLEGALQSVNFIAQQLTLKH